MVWLRHARLDDALAVAALLAACEDADGHPPLSEFKALRVPVANGVRTLVADDIDGGIGALAVAAWHSTEIGEGDGYWAAEVAISPQLRSPERYAELLEGLRRDIGATPFWWTFDAEQRRAAKLLELPEVRAIVEMRRGLPADQPEFPQGYSVRPFVVGVDEETWLRLNQRVFDHHPEAGSIDRADLALRMAQPWFEHAGLLMLVDDASTAVGYCWTKRYGCGVGEIYMIGLAPEHRGRGLGRPLTLAGLQYLSKAGDGVAKLYAEEANPQAVSMYEGMGFEVVKRVTLHRGG